MVFFLWSFVVRAAVDLGIFLRGMGPNFYSQGRDSMGSTVSRKRAIIVNVRHENW